MGSIAEGVVLSIVATWDQDVSDQFGNREYSSILKTEKAATDLVF